jgi:hypothetical protein
MKIAILTEGLSEFKSLPLLYPQLHQRMPARSKIVQTLKVSAQPDATFPQIVASCRPSLVIASRLSDMIIVLLDREQQQSCPGELSSLLEKEFTKATSTPVRVALKDRMFENWLISDIEALRSQPKRFAVDSAAERRISPDKADSVNGLVVIKRMVKNGQYSKTEDSERICRTARVERIAQNSRSFRHFLHVLGHDSYKDGCKLPGRSQTRRGSRVNRRSR